MLPCIKKPIGTMIWENLAKKQTALLVPKYSTWVILQFYEASYHYALLQIRNWGLETVRSHVTGMAFESVIWLQSVTLCCSPSFLFLSRHNRTQSSTNPREQLSSLCYSDSPKGMWTWLHRQSNVYRFSSTRVWHYQLCDVERWLDDQKGSRERLWLRECTFWCSAGPQQPLL